MHKKLTKLIGGMAIVSLVAVACTSKVDTDEQGQPNPDPQPDTIAQSSNVSDCGGFAGTADSGTDDLAYCDAEVLSWSYDAATQKLYLTDSRIELNCCGEHESVIELRGGVYVVTQTDAPELYDGQEARCNCSCVFDYSLTAEGIPERLMQIQIIRHVTDQGGPQTIFEGSLDLSAGSGQEILDTSPAYMCMDESAPS